MASVNFKRVTLKREVPGTNGEEYLEIRRLTSGEERHRSSIGSQMVISGSKKDKNNETIMKMKLDEMKMFEFEKCIIDYRLIDDSGHVLEFGSPEQNRKVYEHFDSTICDLFDSMMEELNGTEEDKEELVKNLESSSGQS